MTKTIIPLLANTPKKLITLTHRYSDADGFEIWIDQFSSKHQNAKIVEILFQTLNQKSNKILVAVVKSGFEHGKSHGTDREKIDLLLAAIEGGADYVDVPVDTMVHHLERLKRRKKKTKLILSFHDFGTTPRKEALLSVVQHMKDLEADVVKIATMVRSDRDADRLMHLALELKGIPHIIIGMGKKGIITRVFSEELGNELTFVVGEKGTAEGQLTLQETRRIARLLNC